MNTVTETVNLQAPPTPIIFTDSAAAKVKDLLIEEGNNNLKLRVFVQGGRWVTSSRTCTCPGAPPAMYA